MTHDLLDCTSIIRPLYNETRERAQDGLPQDNLNTVETTWDDHTDGYGDTFYAKTIEAIDSDLREQLDQYQQDISEYNQLVQDLQDLKRDPDVNETLPGYMKRSQSHQVELSPNGYGGIKLEDWIMDNRGVILHAADEQARTCPGGLEATPEGYLYETLYLQGEYPGVEVDELYTSWESRADEGGSWAGALWDVIDENDVPDRLTRMRELDRSVRQDAEAINERLGTLIEESIESNETQSLMDQIRSLL